LHFSLHHLDTVYEGGSSKGYRLIGSQIGLNDLHFPLHHLDTVYEGGSSKGYRLMEPLVDANKPNYVSRNQRCTCLSACVLNGIQATNPVSTPHQASQHRWIRAFQACRISPEQPEGSHHRTADREMKPKYRYLTCIPYHGISHDNWSELAH